MASQAGLKAVALLAERLLTEREAAEMLAVSPTTLATWRSRRRYALPFIRLGSARAIRYLESDVLAFITSGRVAVGDSGLPEAAAAGGA